MFANGCLVPFGNLVATIAPFSMSNFHQLRAFMWIELQHWFTDPDGIKSKRDMYLEKKCKGLARMAELKKNKEKRMDLPVDAGTH